MSNKKQKRVRNERTESAFSKESCPTDTEALMGDLGDRGAESDSVDDEADLKPYIVFVVCISESCGSVMLCDVSNSLIPHSLSSNLRTRSARRSFASSRWTLWSTGL